MNVEMHPFTTPVANLTDDEREAHRIEVTEALRDYVAGLDHSMFTRLGGLLHERVREFREFDSRLPVT